MTDAATIARLDLRAAELRAPRRRPAPLARPRSSSRD